MNHISDQFVGAVIFQNIWYRRWSMVCFSQSTQILLMSGHNHDAANSMNLCHYLLAGAYKQMYVIDIAIIDLLIHFDLVRRASQGVTVDLS